jgi:hypothetical protein
MITILFEVRTLTHLLSRSAAVFGEVSVACTTHRRVGLEGAEREGASEAVTVSLSMGAVQSDQDPTAGAKD